jgi:oligopeptide/dipeptide ABC transporter ATP-binding protein
VSAASLLSVRDLVTEFETREGRLRAVDGVSFEIAPGETVGIVGESGSGKSVTALSVLRLLPTESARITGGSVLFEGRDLVTMPRRELRRIRGKDIAMVFQDPMAFLNPTLTIGRQLTEGIRAHTRHVTRAQANARAAELLDLVGIPNPRRCLRQYAHEYSGGMRQRVMIAMAISNNPKLLIADEPTTALDVTIQAQIVDVLKRVQEETNAAVILITHNLALASEMVDRVIVMYGGRIVEQGPVRSLFDNPQHPYTCGLIASLPRLDVVLPRLAGIPGHAILRLGTLPGCVFEARCGLAQGRERCRTEAPPLARVAEGHESACHFHDEVATWRATALDLGAPVGGDRE